MDCGFVPFPCPSKGAANTDTQRYWTKRPPLFTSKGGVKATFKADNFTEGNFLEAPRARCAFKATNSNHTGYDYLVQRRNAMELHESQ